MTAQAARARKRPKGARGPGEDAVPGLAARRVAAKLLGAVIDARTPLDGLVDREHGHPHFMALEDRDRGLVRAILASALRHHNSIAALIAARLDRPLPANAAALDHLLHVACAQILFLDIPDSAAVNIAVEQAGTDPRTRRFAPLVNAVLREIARRRERALPAVLSSTLDAPPWFVDRLQRAYGARHAASIHAAHRVEPSIDFTVKTAPGEWAERLGGIVLPNGSVRLAALSGPVSELPGFAEGDWWIQDAAASLPARLFGEVSGLRLVDLCAAPGGKTAQLAFAGADVVALDRSANRLRRLEANLDRLRLHARIVEGDAETWRPDTLLDGALLDAPCSSTGTVRRHPDVPWTKDPTDIAALAALQGRLLRHAATVVRPGGTVVFSNCSLDPEEGEGLLEAVLADTPSLVLDPVDPSEVPGIADFVTPSGTVRTTPAGYPHADPRLAGLDGFFAVRLRKVG